MSNLDLSQHEETLSQITRNLSHYGLQIVRSFDFQTTQATCQCTQCASEAEPQCQCQLTVFLIYDLNHPPVTLMAHQRKEQTWFSLVNTPQQPAAPELEAVITAVLAQGYNTSPSDRSNA
jgi:hypothetical protein